PHRRAFVCCIRSRRLMALLRHHDVIRLLGPSERDSSQFSARRWDHSPASTLSVILFDRGDCRMSAWTEDDKQIAARALKTLEQARVASRGAAIYCLESVRGEMASKRPDDIPERTDAWL